MSGNPSSQNGLSPQGKRELLEKLLREKAAQNTDQLSNADLSQAARTDRNTIQPLDRSQRYFPLSSAQQRFWLLDQIEPGNPVHNIPIQLQLKGELNLHALEQSLLEIQKRHEILRVNFTTVDGKPVQFLTRNGSIPLFIKDLSNEPESSRLALASAFADEDSKRSFDLTNGPLARASIFRLGSDDHLFQFVIHHIVFDGWSMNIFLREFTSLYTAFSTNEEPILPPLPIQYIDFAGWEADQGKEGLPEEHINYWKDQLAGNLPILEMPLDKPRPAIQSFHSGKETLDVPSELTQKLNALSRQQQVTPFVTMLSVYYVLLSRYTAQEDLIVGTPVTRRSRAELENLLGIFINNLALRTDTSGNIDFIELLNRVRRTVLDAITHQEVPFETLLNELHVERDPSRTPIFQVLFNLIDVRKGMKLEIPSLTIEAPPPPETGAHFDLTLYVQHFGDTLKLRLVYNSDLFSKARMAELLHQYYYLLQQVVTAPDQPIQSFSLVTPSVSQRLPNPTEPLDSHWYGSVHSRFTQSARQCPDQVALVDKTGCWTYERLEKSSNQLAHYLMKNGIQRGEVVAIYAHRGASLVWAMLGALKAGAAFLILDPAYPPSLLVEYLKIARPHGFLHLQEAGALPEILVTGIRTELSPEVVQLYCTVDTPDFLSNCSEQNPDLSSDPEDLAYIAFTSGSTGQPKAIVGTHRPLSHFFQWHTDTFHLRKTDRFSMLSGLAHDPLLRDIFTPLWLGATLCIPDQDSLLDSAQLYSWMRDQRVCIIHLTPSLEQILTEATHANEHNKLEDLRFAFFGGESLTRHHVNRLKQVAPSVSCVNFYGATETPQAMAYTVVHASSASDHAPSAHITERIPLGRGIQDVQVLVLNNSGQMAGVGEIGEIHIRTPYLSQGYLQDPALTQQRFIINPFTRHVNDKLYKTGDQGRFLDDGSVEFAGRKDNQVKIRGHRIEVGEIESRLVGHPRVKECVVATADDGSGGLRLVAYIVPDPTEFPKMHELKGYLQQHLPAYMIPSRFILINAIPLTPNGKLDRRALPKPDIHAASETRFIAPQTQLQELLSEIWKDVLHVEAIGIHDNFFDLGGHSLLATQIVSRVQQLIHVNFPVRTLFEFPTIATMAKEIESYQRESIHDIPALQPYSQNGPRRLSFSQERMWFLHQLAPESSAYNIFAAARFKGRLNQSFLESSLKSIVKRQKSLRTVFSTVDGQPIQMITSEPATVLSIFDLQTVPKDAVEARIIELLKAHAVKPFDLVNGPLFRALLVQLNADEHILAITMHHVISDQWSMGVFTRELIAVYETLDSGQSPNLVDLPIQYADFAQWQREALHGKMLQTQLEYWKKQLQGLQVLELPTDKPRPSIQTYNGARLVHSLLPQLIEKMRLLTRSEQVTQFILALTVFNVFLSRYTDQEDITVGIPTANRDRVEIEPVIGTFVNTLVLRTDLSGNPTFKELLRRVRQTTLDGLANKDLPFARLVEELRPDRDMSYSPLTQVLFNSINTPFEYPRLRDLTITPIAIDKASTQFDLSVALSTDVTPLLSLSFNTDLFDEATGQRMLTHLIMLLEDAVENPDKHLSDLQILAEAEGHQLLVEWNNTRANYPKDLCLHQLFELQAERTPKAVAVRYGGQQLTYEELNRRANQLAHYLHSLGVGPEICVGICVERSLEMVIGLMGILKAGGTYLPLDPAFPIDRLEYMMCNSKASILLTKGDLRVAKQLIERLPEQNSRLIYLDKDWAAIESHAKGIGGKALPTQVTPDNLAYIIYTSGSTGKPKGVQLLHKAAVNFLASMEREPGLTSDDILFSITTLSFDISVLEIFLPLVTGASVVLVDREIAFDAVRLAQHIQDSKATVMQATPATWYMLKESGWKGDRSLKVLCGGEALAQDLADWLVDRVESLWNMYGPTETTVWSTVGQVEPGTKRITVGRPIANTQIYILDNNLHPVPTGVPGELFIGGDGVARGYLNQPQLTAERFIPNPFVDDPEARIYRTGDKARYLVDGQIEILGRADSQVKIRGFRIELGEIESNLNQHPDVQQAVVIVREDSPGDKHLVAYFVPKNDHSLQSKDLRQYLRTSLPEYMIPSFFVTLDKFPMTPNQKVNRKALPKPDMENPSAHAVKVAARNGVEEKLVTIWQELLHTQSPGINDDFFDLGGHSLMAVHMFTRIKDEFGVNLPLATLFQEATIEHLAIVINTEIKPTTWSSLIEIEPQGNHTPFFCIHGITGDILWFRELARSLAPDYPFYGLQARGLDGVQDPIPRIDEMAAHYIDEIRRLQPKGPYYLGGASFGGTVALEVAQQLLRQGDQVALLAIFDHSPPNIKIDAPQGKLKRRLIFILKVLRNLPNWFREFLQLDPSQMLMRVRRKLRLARKPKGQSGNGIPEMFDAADLIDFATDLSDYRQRLITTHFEATRLYQPESYPGRVTLFRAISRPLLDTHDPEMGWQKLAPGRVDVSNIPSSHEGMFKKPHVQYLAQRLKASMDQSSNQEEGFAPQ